MRLVIVFLCAVGLTPAAAGAQDLLAGWIEAAGGARVWDNVRTLEYVITTVWYDTSGVEVRRRPRHIWIRKDPGAYKVRVERTEAEGDFVQVWDGLRAWGTLNGEALGDSTHAVREVQYVAGELSYWIGLPWKLKDPGVMISQESDGVVHVRFRSGTGFHDGDRYWYYWRNPASRFPTDVEYIEQGRAERVRIAFSEWTRIGSAVYASKRMRVDSLGRATRGFLISDVKINQAMPASLFTGS